MAKIRKIYDQTIKPDGSKTTIYPITSTRAVYTPAGDTLDFLLSHGGIMHNAFDVEGYQVVSSVDDLPEGETKIGYLIKDNLYIWVGTGGDTKNGMYQNCGTYRGPKGASAYEVAVQNGYEGTEEEWLNDSVNGIKGVGVSETEIDHTDEQSGTSTIKFKYNNGEEFELAVKNGTGIVSVEEQASTEDSGVSLWTVNLSDGTSHSFNVKNGKGIASVTQETTGVGSDAPNIIRVSYSDGTSTTFTVKNGSQGNSGYTGAAGELEVVNNITDGGAAKALSAEMGKVLKSYIDDGYEFRGVVTANTTPAAILSGHKVFYIAATPGTYTNFGNLEIPSDRVAIIYYNGSGSWTRTLTHIPSETRVNIASRGVHLALGAVVTFDDYGWTGYSSSSLYDCVWVKILPGCTKLTLSGAEGSRFCFFSDYDPSLDAQNYITYNRTGLVPSNAKLCIINFNKESNPAGYDKLDVTQTLDFLSKSYFNSVFNQYTRSTPRGKNYIDASNVLYGYNISNGTVYPARNGIMSNRLFLTDGQTYTFSGIPYYGTSNKIFYAKYRADGKVIGIEGLSCIKNSGYGTATFTFNAVGGQVEYIRVCLAPGVADKADFNPAIAQLEAGDSATDFEAYSGTDTLDVSKFGHVEETYFNTLFEKYIRTVALGKNFFNPEKFLPGYQYQSGKAVPNNSGLLSNRIFLENGKTYTFQGVPYYHTTGYCYYGMYDAEGNLLQVKKLVMQDPESTGYGLGSFTFSSNNGKVAYIRFLLQANTSHPFVPDNAQLEEGGEATEIEGFSGKDIFVIDTGGDSGGETPIATRRKVRILCIGNSYTGDEMYYVPFILPGLAELDVEIGYLYRSGESVKGHWANFQDGTTYAFYVYRGKWSWESLGQKTIQEALALQQWDFIIIKGGTSYVWTMIQPYLNNLINGIFGELNYPVKFAWAASQTPPYSNAQGQAVPEEERLQHLYQIWANSQRILNETVCEVVIPVGTAVENARTTSLDDLGDYGRLTEDGVHLQDGVPRQIAAYTVCMTLLELCGFSDRSVFGDTTRVTEEWLDGKNVQQRQGIAIGSTGDNCRVAQICAIMAHKHPYQITDISQMI